MDSGAGQLGRRCHRLANGFACLVIALTITAGTSSLALAEAGELQVPNAAEAWFATPPADDCASPAGCPPVIVPPVPLYPAHTLHVGIAGGLENARSYLNLDVSSLPADATATTGTLVLPVSTDAQAGNAQVAAAQIVACLSVERVPDGVEGSYAKPPAISCSATARASYQAKTGTFTIDLANFLRAWNAGEPRLGLVLLPAAGSPATEAWHVAFNGRGLQGVPHISSTLNLTSTAPVDPSGPPVVLAPVPPPGALPGSGVVPVPVLGPVVQTSGPAQEVELAAAPAAAAAAQITGPTEAADHAFHYPQLLLLPWVLAIGAVYLVRTLLADPKPARPQEASHAG